jgi:ABC-2 type transport system ATP-binding protein
VSGANLTPLQTDIEHKTGVDMVAPFGNSLHVSGRDAAKLEAAIKPYRGDKKYDWEKSEPSLEDVFIDLMSRSKDNFQ